MRRTFSNDSPTDQFELLPGFSSKPEGLRYAPEFVPPAADQKFILEIASLPVEPFQFGQI
jgi:hypothetical protein